MTIAENSAGRSTDIALAFLAATRHPPPARIDNCEVEA
jgi:hypothetical protein